MNRPTFPTLVPYFDVYFLKVLIALALFFDEPIKIHGFQHGGRGVVKSKSNTIYSG